MATINRVTCKEKHSLYERIASIGCVDIGTGATRRFTEDEAIASINQGTHKFYVERPEGHRVWVIVAKHEGREYIKTETDGEKPNNLLSLPDCPPKKVEPSPSRRTLVAAASHGDVPPALDNWVA
jgi:hypothetical protein